MAALGLGTYRCRNVADAAAHATAAGVAFVDTAPNYADGTAHTRLAPALRTHPDVQVSTKVGFVSGQAGADAVRDGVLTAAAVRTGHSLAPDYVRWQVARNRSELGRDRLDLVFVHNPETAEDPRSALLGAFRVLEREARAARIGGYGVATWSGFTHGAFTVADLLGLAAHAAADTAGDGRHHLRAVQLPVSLVRIEALAQALDRRGPIAEAAAADLAVFASAPLHGGDLPRLVTCELADLIGPGLTPAQACLHAVMSCPGLSHVLLSASTAAHWRDAARVRSLDPLTPDQLREITRVLAPT